ncbi:MAG: hypothetical protein KGJ09_03000 [Candidatus Omnitrophica bacterium]|nr:hypothetical protein [Candidatus Omnitrophota bacterium]
MKKLIALAAVLVLSSAVVFAQDTSSNKNVNGTTDKPSMMDQGGMMGQGMMGPGMMHKGMMMHGMMMRMMNASMVATSDGGVVVFTGDRLIKYDKDLNVVKEVKIKGYMPAWEKTCPIMNPGMMKAEGKS